MAIDLNLPEGWEMFEEVEDGVFMPHWRGPQSIEGDEYYQPHMATHHRVKIEVYGPWIEGKSPRARRDAEILAQHEAERKRREENRILAQAEKIRREREGR